MFAPINIRVMQQGQGCPLIDHCTTTRKFTHDEGTGETHAIYNGFAICPLWFKGSTWAVAVTVFKRTHVYGDVKT